MGTCTTRYLKYGNVSYTLQKLENVYDVLSKYLTCWLSFRYHSDVFLTSRWCELLRSESDMYDTFSLKSEHVIHVLSEMITCHTRSFCYGNTYDAFLIQREHVIHVLCAMITCHTRYHCTENVYDTLIKHLERVIRVPLHLLTCYTRS